MFPGSAYCRRRDAPAPEGVAASAASRVATAAPRVATASPHAVAAPAALAAADAASRRPATCGAAGAEDTGLAAHNERGGGG